MTRRLPLLLGALAFAAAFQVSGQSAEANGHVHFSGGAHFSGGVHVSGGFRGGVHYARPAWGGRSYYRGGYGYRSGGWGRGGWHTGGHIYVGGGYWPGYYYYRPYPYYYYYTTPEAVPSYYPVQPGQPGVAAQAVIAPPPQLPKLGVGVFAGGISVQDVDQSTDVGILARLRLGNGGLLVEGELAKTSFKDDTRVDRRLGGSLIYEFGARNALAPYVLAGLGVNQSQTDGDYNTTQDFAEIGVGLRLALSRNLHLTFDVRAGSRNTVSSDNSVSNGLARSIAPPPSGSNDNEDYTRARLAAILMF